jgi:Tol biopolymer transport system component
MPWPQEGRIMIVSMRLKVHVIVSFVLCVSICMSACGASRTSSTTTPSTITTPAPTTLEPILLYTRYNPTQQREELWRIALDGRNDRLLLAPDCTQCTFAGIAVSPDKSQLAYLLSTDGSPSTLHIVNADGSNDREIGANVCALGGQAFSPNGTLLAVARCEDAEPAPVPQSSIWVIKTDGSDSKQITPWGYFLAAPAWSSDTSLIFSKASIGTPLTNWHTFSADVQEATQPMTLTTGLLVAVSPDRTALLSQVEDAPEQSRSDQFNLGVTTIKEGTLQLLTQSGGFAPTAAWSPDSQSVAVCDPTTAKLELVHLREGTRETLHQEIECSAILWEDTGRSIFYERLGAEPGPITDRSATLQRFDFATGVTQDLTHIPSGRLNPTLHLSAPN